MPDSLKECRASSTPVGDIWGKDRRGPCPVCSRNVGKLGHVLIANHFANNVPDANSEDDK